MTDAGELVPAPLEMTPEGFAVWRRFYDNAERELAQGGELTDVRDVASKAGENCARIAALFHLFENGPCGRIQVDHVAAAIKLMTWHLFEARRLLAVLALPESLSNAAKTDGPPARTVMRSRASVSKAAAGENLGSTTSAPPQLAALCRHIATAYV